MKKLKNDYLVFSIFSSELQDYPYYPFVCKDYTQALLKFVNFVSNRDTIAPGAELHCIGSCKVEDGEILDGSIQPLVCPVVVTSKSNVISKGYLLGNYYIEKAKSYIKSIINERGKLWKKKK